jgi:hypothetical protein
VLCERAIAADQWLARNVIHLESHASLGSFATQGAASAS